MVKTQNINELAKEYLKTKDEKLISVIQKILTIKVKYFLRKWKIATFPKLIYEELLYNSLTIILVQVLNKYNPKKGSKFLSYYLTSLNFYLRAEYQKYFQNGKPIQKRWGRLHEYSFSHSFGASPITHDTKTLEYFLPASQCIREDAEQKLINIAFKKLHDKDRKLLEAIYVHKKPQYVIQKKFKLSKNKLDNLKNEALKKLHNLI